jgi:hypothetical protein
VNHKQFSSKGGKAGRGAAKARTAEQALAAVMARWSKPRKTKRVTAKPNAPVSDGANQK